MQMRKCNMWYLKDFKKHVYIEFPGILRPAARHNQNQDTNHYNEGYEEHTKYKEQS